jgi:P-type Ca2+ transporter type 2C
MILKLNGEIKPLNKELVESVKSANKDMTGKALRVLAVAFKIVDSIHNKVTAGKIENELVFAELVGMMDIPRREVKEAVGICASTGIRHIMITGGLRDTVAALSIIVIVEAGKKIPNKISEKSRVESTLSVK